MIRNRDEVDRRRRWWMVALLPFLMGGCPAARNAFVDSFETAIRSVVNGALDDLFRPFNNGTS